MINILQVVPTLGYGGVAKVVRNYYDVIDHERYHFDFVTHGGEEDYHAELIHEGSRIYYFQTIGKLGARNYRKQVLNAVQLDQYDIVHIHIGGITGLYAMNYKKCGARKIICHAHTSRAISKQHKMFEKLFRLMALKYSDMTMACGYEAGEYCFGKNRYVFLPNGINYESFNDVSNEQILKVRQELNISESAFVVGHVGHFSSPKNHYFLLEFAYAYIKKHPETVFILCGSGPRFDDVKEKISEAGLENSILLTGIRNDVNVLMHLFDVFVLPSLHEGLPVVGIEAQTVGLPCLLSDRIDKCVDIGCGLCTFLPISDGIDKWVDAISYEMERRQRGESGEIKEALNKSDYDINKTVSILSKEYDKLAKQ